MLTGAQQRNGKFVNSDTPYAPKLSEMWDIIKQMLTAPRIDKKPTSSIPIKTITSQQLDDSSDAIFRLGHSTILMRLNGEYILTDPMFSHRASPLQWIGPKRFHNTPISIVDLPKIKTVIISHDHYDHLDKKSVLQLKDKVEHFITPLKVGDYLIKWGIDKEKVTQLDWWQEKRIDSLNIVATPAQHFSGRSLFDRDKTLWASWVIQSDTRSLFFSADGGYFSGFKQIGEKYGPFDVTMMETGAYNELWSEIHMLPEQSLQAHLDLQGRYLLPIHNATFDLAQHAWYEPLEHITALADEHNAHLLTPEFGETTLLDKPMANTLWWKRLREMQNEPLVVE